MATLTALKRWIRSFLPLVALAVLLVYVSQDAVAQFTMNGSEPWFTRGIGPTEPRSDNPVAAVVTTVGVGIAFYLGLSDDTVNPA